MNDAKVYEAVHIRYEDNNIRYGEGCGVEVVTRRDYRKVQAERDQLKARLAELESALAGLIASVSGGSKACGHDFECVCALDKAHRQLESER